MTEGKMFILDANAVEAAGRWGSVMAFLNKIKPEMMAMIELVREKKAIKVHISIVEVDIAVPEPRVLKTKENQNVAETDKAKHDTEPVQTSAEATSAEDSEPADADLPSSSDGQSEDTGESGQDEDTSSNEGSEGWNAETSDDDGATEELDLDNVDDEFADVVNEENDPAGEEGADKTKGEG